MKLIHRILVPAILLCAAFGWGVGHAQGGPFTKYGPVAGIQKSTGLTYTNTAAVAADIIGLYTGTCSATTFLKGAGACGAVVLTTDVSGILPPANGGLGGASPTAHGVLLGEGASAVVSLALGADTVLRGVASADPAAAAVPNCGSSTTALNYNTTTHAFGCQTIATGGTGTVTSVTAGTGLTASPNPIIATGTVSLDLTAANTWSGIQTFSAAPVFNAGSVGSTSTLTTLQSFLTNTSTNTSATVSAAFSNGSDGISIGSTGTAATSNGVCSGVPAANHSFICATGNKSLSIGTQAVERIRITGSGNVTVNAVTAGTIALTVAGSSESAQGITANTASGTPVTIFSTTGVHEYIAFCVIPTANDASNYSGTYLVSANGSSMRVDAIRAGALMTMSASGLNVQCVQGSGASSPITWHYFQMF